MRRASAPCRLVPSIGNIRNMNTIKETLDEQDPDYATPAPSDEKQQKLYEENARANTARKITDIVEKEFSKEIDTKEKEVLQIQNRLHKALKTLHLLRYVIITDFYNRKQCQVPQSSESKQSRIHPAIKQLIGKSPKQHNRAPSPDPAVPSTSKDPRFLDVNNSTSIKEDSDQSEIRKRLGQCDEDSNKSHRIAKRSCESLQSEEEPAKKVPRYIPPKSGIPEPPCPSRGLHHKVRKRIVVGNISKWIPPDWREDAASHKWTMYVRGSKEDADISNFVSKVRFFLHPSYQPNDVVEVTSPPFHLSRRGWGEFPLRVQLHFKNVLNKPMDIIHYLKLDRTYTGLQTLGSETVVDIWIKTMKPRLVDANIDAELSPVKSSTPVNENNVCIDATVVKDEFPPVENKAVESIDLNNSIKREPLGINDIRKFSVEFDHDYLSSEQRLGQNYSQIIHSAESNITIEHLPSGMMRHRIVLDGNNTRLQNGVNGESASPACKEDSVLCEESTTKADNEYIGNVKNMENPNKNTSQDTKSSPLKSVKVTVKTDSEVSGRKFENLRNGCVAIKPIQAMTPTDKVFLMSNVGNMLQQKIYVKNSTTPDKVTALYSNKLYSNLKTRNTSNSAVKVQTEASANIQSSVSPVETEDTKNMQQIEMQKLVTSVKNLPGKLQPLKITIPPTFEPAKKNQFLVLKNNKLIPVNATSLLKSKQEGTSSVIPAVKESVVKEILPADNKKISLINAKCIKSNAPLVRGVSLLKKPPTNNTNTQKSMVLKINPSNSLLLNQTSSVPALQIASPLQAQQKVQNDVSAQQEVVDQLKVKKFAQTLNPEAQDNGKVAKIKVTLGKDKYKILSKKEAYEEVIKSIEAVERKDLLGTLKYIIKRLPLVTKEASDAEYRRIHPYACRSEEEFFNCNIGKQRALEWCRAKTVRNFLRKKGFPEDELWSAKEIIIWARLHGFTPIRFSLDIGRLAVKTTKKMPDTSDLTCSTSTEPTAFNEWLESLKDSKNPQNDQDSDIEVDVVHVVQQNLKAKVKEEPEDQLDRKIALELPRDLESSHAFVDETARNIGIRLQPEEIIPGVSHCAAGRVIIKAVQCLVEDLTRLSLAKAWQRSSNKCPETIILEDVRNALLSREEFDLFTNAGLGSQRDPNDWSH
ncbi:uncharacterized protein LOC107272294 isoform X2 [Cephus cinctus]|nr:uncharacterized protein LOC107272294 isoform X2 [Cephus cinctus]